MFSRVSFRTIAAVVLVATLMAVPAMAQQWTQLRYFKTTDFGASWSTITQAGDMSTAYQTRLALWDFDAVTMANDELCYAVYLPGSTPGVYAMAGPNFTPVVAIPEGTYHMGIVANGGWSTIGRTPNGDLFIVCWAGAAADSANTLIGVKSTNNGTSWGTPFVVATSAQLPVGSLYVQMSQMNSADWVFCVFQDENFEQFALRFPTAGGAGTITDLAVASGSEVSYYIGSVQPIAYDNANNALYICFRNTDVTGVAVYYSDDQGATWTDQSVSGAQRYPSLALNAATQVPYVFSNYGVPADSGVQHYSWYAKDEGYGAGLWSDPINFASVTYQGSSSSLLYVNQGYWWDANHGVSTHNYWAPATPNGLYTNYTTDGGTNWTTVDLRYLDVDAQLSGANNWGLTGAGNGVAYAWSSGRIAPPDIAGPTFADVTLVTPTTDPGPWTLTAMVTDEGNDTSDIHLTWFTPADSDTVISPSAKFVITDPNTNSGTAMFHLPANRPHGGTAYATGDTVWFYLWSRDLSGNNGRGSDMALVVGGDFLGVNEPTPVAGEHVCAEGRVSESVQPHDADRLRPAGRGGGNAEGLQHDGPAGGRVGGPGSVHAGPAAGDV